MRNGLEQQLGVDSRRLMRVLIVVSDRLVAGVLGGHPRVALELDAPLLESPHPLDRNRDAKAQEVIEFLRFRVFKADKQPLDAPKLRVHDTEQLLDSIMPSGPMTL